MAVDTLLKSIEMAGQSKDKSRKRAAAEQQGKAMDDLGTNILGSTTGQTEIGSFVGQAVKTGLVENPLQAIQMLQMTPEQLATQFSMKGWTDPKARELGHKALGILDAINFTKANAQYRAMRANGLGGGSGGGKGGSGTKEKATKFKVDANAVFPQIMNAWKSKYDPENKDGVDKYSVSNYFKDKFDADTFKQSDAYFVDAATTSLKQTYPILNDPKAAGALNEAVERMRGMAYSDDPASFGSYSTGEDKDSKNFRLNSFETYIPQSLYVDHYLNGDVSANLGYEIVQTNPPGEDQLFPEGVTGMVKAAAEISLGKDPQKKFLYGAGKGSGEVRIVPKLSKPVTIEDSGDTTEDGDTTTLNQFD